MRPCTLLMIVKSLLGGGLMFSVGALYLFFEKKILASTSPKDEASRVEVDGLSRVIMGVQASTTVSK